MMPRLLMLIACATMTLAAQTFAERLGFPKNARVVILHMDDAGMSFDSNRGMRDVVEHGVTKSMSVMMPCPWVPEIVHYIKKHPDVDAGLHLTLTSEWKDYRWGALSGAPGLLDDETAMWRSVEQVAQHASPEEVDREIRAQYDRAIKMGFQPTHIDSHMGTLFATPQYLEKYVKLGMEKHLPVMLPGGHNTNIASEMKGSEALQGQMQKLGQMLWASGLPVLDDLHNTTYGWKPPAEIAANDAAYRKWRTAKYIKALEQLKPGLTMIIMHCTSPTEVFEHISDSGVVRKGDMLVMTDPEFKAFLEKNGFIVTTWREVAERRKNAK